MDRRDGVLAGYVYKMVYCLDMDSRGAAEMGSVLICTVEMQCSLKIDCKRWGKAGHGLQKL